MEHEQDVVPAPEQENDTGHRSLGWLLGPLATGLGLAAHVAAGGQPPGLLIVAALAALLAMAAAMVGPRRFPGWAVLLAAGLAQQLLHLAFTAFSLSTGVELPGHGHGQAPSPGTPVPEGSTAPQDLHLMLHVHVAAALLTVAFVTQWGRLVSLAQGKTRVRRRA